MSIRVLINGCKGKMGTLATSTIQAHTDLEYVHGCERHDDLATAITQHQPDVVIDLTAPDSVYENAQTIIAQDVHPVIGTSGLQPKEIEALQQTCAHKKLGGMIVPNFSLGAVLMMQLAKQVARYLPHAEIIESHHPHKLDIPSATAQKTAELIAAGRLTTPPPSTCKQPACHVAGIPIHSMRLPGIVANQTVCFGGEDETLEIQHRTLSRHAFMPGLCLACTTAPTLSTLVYGLEAILDLDQPQSIP